METKGKPEWPEQAGKHPTKSRLGTNDKHPLVRSLGYAHLYDGVCICKSCTFRHTHPLKRRSLIFLKSH